MLSISDESLGAEGSMSEVGIPLPHNSDKPHAPVAGNYHTIPRQKPKKYIKRIKKAQCYHLVVDLPNVTIFLLKNTSEVMIY